MSINTFSFTVTNHIAIITVDCVDESVNTLKISALEEVHEILDKIEGNKKIKGLVIQSGKPNSFIVGADINMLDICFSIKEAQDISQAAQKVFLRIAQLTIPVVALVHGACLGGGLELALACDYRIISDSTNTILGLPEVQLGLLPGGGGTQRLTQLIGARKALELMLIGKNVRPTQALKLGIVDEVVHVNLLNHIGEKYIKKGKRKSSYRCLKGIDKIIERSYLLRQILFSLITKKINKMTKGHYPAPKLIIRCVRQFYHGKPKKGYDFEASAFGKLVMSPESRALRSIFFANNELKKEVGVENTEPKKVNKVFVFGGGLMGSGIAAVTAFKAKIPVRVKDLQLDNLSYVLNYAYKLLYKKLKKKFIRPIEVDREMNRITTTTNNTGIYDADIVIEAVFEDLKLKQQIVLEAESCATNNVIIATNTSSIPIAQIAQNAKRPENIIGLHYFSPVEKMPLVEVIPHEKTSQETIATTIDFAKKQGKIPILVKDKAGFFVNRILAIYMNEAAELLKSGITITEIDSALQSFGFPIGPISLLDEVGIDVGVKIGPILETLGTRFKAPEILDLMIKNNKLGKKNNNGFYVYQGKKKKEAQYVYHYIQQIKVIQYQENKNNISQRCVVQMLNESVRCLEEGVIASPRDADIAAIFGIGFPPYLGGPFRYMEYFGLLKLVNLLKQYQDSFGDRFTPCNLLIEKAENETLFY